MGGSCADRRFASDRGNGAEGAQFPPEQIRAFHVELDAPLGLAFWKAIRLSLARVGFLRGRRLFPAPLCVRAEEQLLPGYEPAYGRDAGDTCLRFRSQQMGRIFFAEYVGSALRISLTLRASSLACDGPYFFLGVVGLSSRVDSLRLSKCLPQRWKRNRRMPKCQHVRLALGFPSLESLGDSSRCQSKILRRCLAFADRLVVSSFAGSLWRGDGVMNGCRTPDAAFHGCSFCG